MTRQRTIVAELEVEQALVATNRELIERFVPARRPGRWLIHTRHAGRAWRVVVEPDPDEKTLVIVTAYPKEVSP